MRIFEEYMKAMKLVGCIPVVEGRIRTIFVVIGFLGIAASMGAVCFFNFDPRKYFKLFVFLIVAFCIMFTLPLYYPQGEKK